MATHPYISGPGNISQIVNILRRNFPATVNSDTVKKYSITSNNESYVINTLQFLGVIDADGKKTSLANDVFSKHEDTDFQNAFSDVVKNSYTELFELHGDEAWNLERSKLIGYFRQADKTSDTIGGRQAAVFQVLASLGGKSAADLSASKQAPRVTKAASVGKATTLKSEKPAKKSNTVDAAKNHGEGGGGVTLNVRIEVNLPPGGDAKTYDAIFRSIREHLMDG